MRSRALLALASAACLVTIPAIAVSAKKKDAKDAKESGVARQFLQQIPKDQRIEQALNRLTFGPRPGDAAQVKAIGLKAWIDQQLHPNRIEENPVLIEKLKTFDTLTMSAEKMVREYPSPQILKQMVAGQMPLPTDPDKRMMIQKRLAKYEKEGDQPPPNAPPDPKALRALLTDDQIRGLREGTPEQRIAFFQTLPVDKQDDVLEAMPRVRQTLSVMASPEIAPPRGIADRAAAGGVPRSG